MMITFINMTVKHNNW